MLHPWIERMMPWRKDRRELQQALESADHATVDAAIRKGRAEAVVTSIRRRVYAENHISAAVSHALKGKP
jgi:hypothetical protein